MTSPPQEGDEAALAARAIGGDQRAFAAMMRRHKDRLYRFIRAYVGDAEESYDLVQESFAAAWQALGRFDARRPFDVWLRRIALNKCRDWSRRRAVRRFFYGAKPLDEAGVETPATPDADQDDRLDMLEAAIARLPAPLKEPLLLTAIDGCSQKEAALLLGVTVKAVETRLYRARALLAAALRLRGDGADAQGA